MDNKENRVLIDIYMFFVVNVVEKTSSIFIFKNILVLLSDNLVRITFKSIH